MDENVRGYYKYIGGQLSLLHKGYGARAMVSLAGGVRSEKGYDMQQKYKDKYVVDREVDGSLSSWVPSGCRCEKSWTARAGSWGQVLSCGRHAPSGTLVTRSSA